MAKKTTLAQLDQKFDTLSGEFRAFREKQDEFVEFLKENVALKSELHSGLQEVRTELRSEIQEVRNEVLTVADQVTKLQETVEIELVAPTRRMDRLERRVTAVERKLGLAT